MSKQKGARGEGTPPLTGLCACCSR
uniref:Uncharacterized protein n=1 Tax=Arundo donax TaxID=35708 RepID=A0A0A9H986_ARUDO